jgi:hypothetical protein
MKRLHAAIVVGGPAAVLVAADFAFEPVHNRGCQLLVYSCWFEKQNTDWTLLGGFQIRKRTLPRRGEMQRSAERPSSVGVRLAELLPMDGVEILSDWVRAFGSFARDDDAR